MSILYCAYRYIRSTSSIWRLNKNFVDTPFNCLQIIFMKHKLQANKY
jgi:hypothetical protein